MNEFVINEAKRRPLWDTYEEELTNIISSSIDMYFQGKFGFSSKMPNDLQALQKLGDKEQFFDLVKRISDYDVLALEVKIRNNPNTRNPRKGLCRLPSYDHPQNKVLRLIYDKGVPVFYCYNNTNDFQSSSSKKSPLILSSTSDPHSICDDDGYITNTREHRTLKDLIDHLMSEKGDGSDVSQLLFMSKALSSRQNRWGVRQLVITYDAFNGRYMEFTSKDLKIFSNLLNRYVNAQMPSLNELGSKPSNEIDLMLQSFRTSFSEEVSKISSKPPRI